ncbi:SsgA family sporulation/cell division regulator [Streptomyces sp. wa53]|uniref:SsgA family sporulation/cell division regulator n=1 Tax=Streptomyces sp. wa53 TaxID=1828268 RepID=UPI003C7C89FD
MFAHDPLTEGTRRPTGAGDVLPLPRRGRLPDTIGIVLRSAAGAALLDISASPVKTFPLRPYDPVAPRTEGTTSASTAS